MTGDVGDFTIMTEQTQPTRFWMPVAILTALGALAFFCVWCVIDYLLVRSPGYPEGIHDYDWIFLVAPFGIFIVDYLLAPFLRSAPRLGVSLLATVLSMALGTVFVLLIGIPFHWSIGGTF